jgi:hypothetical protein
MLLMHGRLDATHKIVWWDSEVSICTIDNQHHVRRQIGSLRMVFGGPGEF